MLMRFTSIASLNSFIYLKLLMKSKKFQAVMNKGMEMAGQVIDDVLFSWIPDMDAMDESFHERHQRFLAIMTAQKQMMNSIEDAAMGIVNVSDEQMAIAQIDKEYRNNLIDAYELNSMELVHLAKVKAEMDRVSYSVGVMRSATDAFTASAQMFLDAVETEGMSEVERGIHSLI